MTKRLRVNQVWLWQLALVEGIFLVIALVILWFRHFAGAVVLRTPLITEAAIGLTAGAVLGALVGFGLLRSPLRRDVVQSALPLRPVISSVWTIVVVGVLAGLAEELLFRAALQNWIGLSWASILFGLAHSGTARLHEGFGVGKLAYLLFTVVAGMLLGLMYQNVGLLASMTAHGAFDIAILLVMAPAILATAD